MLLYMYILIYKKGKVTCVVKFNSYVYTYIFLYMCVM